MSSRSFARLAALITTSVVLAPLCACQQGSKPGDLVGSYSVHGVLVENSCGTNALPTSSSLDFVVEIRLDSGVAYWMPAKASQSSGTLSDAGDFRFTMSETQVVNNGMNPMTRQLEPSDFANAASNPDFDLQQGRACALTRKQTVSGNLARRISAGVVTALAKSKLAGDAGAAKKAPADDDLDGEHVIEVAPTSGSDCNVALAALGGTYTALPCEARYLLSGALDTSGALTGAAGHAGSGGSADKGGSGGTGGDVDAGR